MKGESRNYWDLRYISKKILVETRFENANKWATEIQIIFTKSLSGVSKTKVTALLSHNKFGHVSSNGREKNSKLINEFTLVWRRNNF